MTIKICKIRTVIFLLVVLISGCVPKPLTIAGNSMSPTLNNGDVILVKVTTEDITRNEIVLMIHPKESYNMVARVIGLPGEEVQVSENKVYINGKVLDEPYVDAKNNVLKLKDGKFKIDDNNYFVLGDNRDNSLDSRHFGKVPRENILARYYSTVKKAKN